jgi:diacylglycerol O-acyltransferase / wax synthase
VGDEARDWGGPGQLTAWEALMWRSESDPRTRSTGILLEILDGEPEWERFLEAHERATRAIPRLRERVVEPHLPLVQPVWSYDVRFDLAHHVRRLHLHAPGDHQQLLALCEDVAKRPLDRARPPWEAVLVTGLEGGRAAYLLKLHHSLADGLGLMQLLELAHSRSSAPKKLPLGNAVARAPALTPGRLLSSRLRSAASAAPETGRRSGASALRSLGRVVADPATSLSEALRFTRSLRRMMAPPAISRSPLLANTGVVNRFVTVEVPLDRLKKAGKSAGGSVNDAYVSAVLGGLRRYHEHHDALVDEIPIGMPISLRKADEHLGGNRFAGACFAAPLAEPDPGARMRAIKLIVQRHRFPRPPLPRAYQAALGRDHRALREPHRSGRPQHLQHPRQPHPVLSRRIPGPLDVPARSSPGSGRDGRDGHLRRDVLDRLQRRRRRRRGPGGPRTLSAGGL